ncbi:YggT family protein [[Limnothrix rosea] IAM M-220]|uniref:YggT family protein n=1 Tax=[Limnothrix rosea] IAM M-220 TaxID=454133 RepID=UPI000959BDF9|nr:YggT family protein [[Limnothrix rosea] IAM M-220]OKH19279.1 hypothetical protein NIES208_03235 [[Limnothrix rosea] IAM M-220]
MSNSPHNFPDSDPDPNKPPSSPPPSKQNMTAASREAQKLKREEQKLRARQQRLFFFRVRNSIYFLVGFLEVLLALRFFLRLSGANPDNLFAKSIYGLSAPFVTPFSTLFISPVQSTDATIGQNIFDVNLLIAMMIYGLLGFLAVWLTTYVYQQVSSPDS